MLFCSCKLLPTQIWVITVILAEHPQPNKQTHFHQEMSQGLGVSNNSPNARPSIFNNYDEFALLTESDELLLSILYYPPS